MNRRRTIISSENKGFFAAWNYALWKATHFGYDMVGSPTNPKQMRAFQRQCHRGFDHAQKLIVQLLKDNRGDDSIDIKEKKYREILIRKIADAIAIHLCGGPRGIAYWKTQDAPVHINFTELSEIARFAAAKNAAERDSFHLLSDLTTCIHTCDILRADIGKESKQQITPMEYKTGTKNDQLFRHLRASLDGNVCPAWFVVNHTRKEIDQMMRITKQLTTSASRTHSFLRNRRKVYYEYNSFPLYSSSTFSRDLQCAIDKAKVVSSSSALVDDCLLVGIGFSDAPGNAKLSASAEIDRCLKQHWQGSVSRRFFPLVDNMRSIVSMPFCIWEFNNEDILLLAKRNLVIECALIIEPFLEVLNLHGRKYLLASRKETGKASERAPTTGHWHWENRAIKQDNGLLIRSELFEPISTDLVRPTIIARCLYQQNSEDQQRPERAKNLKLHVKFERS